MATAKRHPASEKRRARGNDLLASLIIRDDALSIRLAQLSLMKERQELITSPNADIIDDASEPPDLAWGGLVFSRLTHPSAPVISKRAATRRAKQC